MNAYQGAETAFSPAAYSAIRLRVPGGSALRQFAKSETVDALDFPATHLSPGKRLAHKDDNMVALPFKKTAVNAEKPQRLQFNTGLLGSLPCDGISQGLSRLHTAPGKIPTVKIGVLDE